MCFRVMQRFCTFAAVVMTVLLISACSSLPFVNDGDEVRVKITSVPLKIILVAGGAALQVAVEEFVGVRIDSRDLLGQIVEFDEAERAQPPSNVPVIVVINKNTNDMLYWQLTDKVDMVRLRHEAPGAIELKVVNDTPLRVELWVEGELEDVGIEVELRD